MSIKNLGIMGGGQLGSLLAVAAKKLDVKTKALGSIKSEGLKNMLDSL